MRWNLKTVRISNGIILSLSYMFPPMSPCVPYSYPSSSSSSPPPRCYQVNDIDFPNSCLDYRLCQPRYWGDKTSHAGSGGGGKGGNQFVLSVAEKLMSLQSWVCVSSWMVLSSFMIVSSLINGSFCNNKVMDNSSVFSSFFFYDNVFSQGKNVRICMFIFLCGDNCSFTFLFQFSY